MIRTPLNVLRTDKRPTFNAAVCCPEIRREILGTRTRSDEGRVRYADTTPRSPGTHAVQLSNDVLGAADVAEVSRHTSAQLHPAEERLINDDDVSWLTARGERLGETEVLAVYTEKKDGVFDFRDWTNVASRVLLS